MLRKIRQGDLIILLNLLLLLLEWMVLLIMCVTENSPRSMRQEDDLSNFTSLTDTALKQL